MSADNRKVIDMPTASSRTPKTKKAATKKPATQAAADPAGKVDPVELGPLMRKKELIDAVVTRSGVKKKDAKPVVEAMLAVLGEALSEKRELALQPLGRVKIQRVREHPNGQVLVTKIRQSGQAKPGTT